MVFHVLSAEADLMDIFYISDGENIEEAEKKLENLDSDQIVIFMTDFLFEVSDTFIDLLISFGFSSDELKKRFKLNMIKF